MAIVIGTNSGFVTTAPTSDPSAGGIAKNVDARLGTKDTSPADAIKITEIGWWRDTIFTGADIEYRVGIYSDNGAGEPHLLVEQSGTIQGGTSVNLWLSVGVDFTITGNTPYWICINYNTLDSNYVAWNLSPSDGSGNAYKQEDAEGAPVFPGDCNASTFNDSDVMYAIYALREHAADHVLRQMKIEGRYHT